MSDDQNLKHVISNTLYLPHWNINEVFSVGDIYYEPHKPYRRLSGEYPSTSPDLVLKAVVVTRAFDIAMPETFSVEIYRLAQELLRLWRTVVIAVYECEIESLFEVAEDMQSKIATSLPHVADSSYVTIFGDAPDREKRNFSFTVTEKTSVTELIRQLLTQVAFYDTVQASYAFGTALAPYGDNKVYRSIVYNTKNAAIPEKRRSSGEQNEAVAAPIVRKALKSPAASRMAVIRNADELTTFVTSVAKPKGSRGTFAMQVAKASKIVSGDSVSYGFFVDAEGLYGFDVNDFASDLDFEAIEGQTVFVDYVYDMYASPPLIVSNVRKNQ